MENTHTHTDTQIDRPKYFNSRACVPRVNNVDDNAAATAVVDNDNDYIECIHLSQALIIFSNY